MEITIINGPNLNLLGSRQKNIYGGMSFEDFLEIIRKDYGDIIFHYYQSNVEGELINFIQKAGSEGEGIILNAAGFTHTSVSIADAVAAIEIPVIEVHISNILAREEFRHLSLVAPNCACSIF